MKQEELLRKIQEVDFACLELNLYLDNNPNNQNALKDYNALANESMKLKKIYEMNFGPLTNFGSSLSQYPFAWINEPWPWEGK
ncbi:spore coat protein CotJB [Tepidibacter thalassicus]|uniref:Spore coat protein JB n=1 Tax=Tepidibacter thalassicus DSM 15285 TaxID=1123350 RepID=A0A1M5S0R3_9FIRM|nr:spore coat protein CotJB [Tepidibacter thalassicus]SHH32070.1 spore coat protein JB [Tepidibacter thalassicus DSM 15285]